MNIPVENWHFACEASDFDGEEMLECRIGDREILLVRTESGFTACPTICPHMEERLIHGLSDGSVLTCTKHLWQWDLNTGDPIGLAEEPITIAAVRLSDGKLYVNLASFECGNEGRRCS